jgi:hypothetical protein
MNTEDRLRDALHGEASRVNPREGWANIESRLNETAPRSRLRVVSAIAAALFVIIAGALALRDGDDAKPVVTNPGTTSPTDAPTTVVPGEAAPKYIWPVDPAAAYRTPEAMAAGYVHEFLGLADATVGAYRAGDTSSGEIDVKTSFGTVISTLLARQEVDGSWHALEAMNPHLVIGNPYKGVTIKSPQKITGSSVAFEGTVHVSLYGYEDWGAAPCGICHPFLGTTTLTGYGTELGPYETSISWPPTTAKWGLLMLWTDSARDGSLAEASVRLYRLG